MLINASHPEENRVAIVVDGILSELDIEIAGQEQSKGNIYKAVVVRVETGLQAAFVDYGADKLGFLQIGEIHPNLYPPKDDTKSRPRIADILKRGQEILVQIVKEERGNKGAALTTFLSIPGRYMVLMPDSTTKGVSRKISDDIERKKLKKTMAELDLPERMGYIVRTAGIGKDKEELKRDFDYLVRLFEGITSHKNQIKAPAQLYQESNLAIRSIRDYFTTDIDEVLIDSQTVYQDAKDFFSLVMPELGHLVKQHRERRPIFSRYQIEEQIDALAKNQIALPSGGSIVIDQTEALVAIDVNSGKMASESGIEATALKTNLEAAAEVGRQLRLRDLGGLVVIDFIDMRDRKNTREVEQALRKALKNDKAKVSVGRISQFGLLEMSRQRLKPVLSVGSFLACPHCKGAGKIKSAEAQAVTLLRQIHTAASKGHIAYIDAKVPMDVANYLLNQKRATIVKLEQALDLEITIYGSSKLLPGDIEVETRKKEKEQDSDNQITPISHANQIEVALAAQQEVQETATPQPEEASALSPEETSTEGAQEPLKKKRRRRRRKPAAKTPPETKTEDQQGDSESPQPETGSQSGEPAEIQETASAEQNTAQQDDQKPLPESGTEENQKPGSTEEKKPRRRSRRQPRRKPASDTTTEVTPEETVTPAEVSTSEVPEVATTSPAPESPAAVEDKAGEQSPAKQEEPEEKPKRRPRRATSSARKKAPSSAADAAETTDPPATDPAKEQDQPEADKPKRRTRKAPAKKAVESSEQEAVITEAKPATPAAKVEGQEQPEEVKPKRRTRRTTASKAKAAETSQTEPTEPTAADSSAESSVEEKPKRRTRRPASTRSKTAKTETSAATEEAPAQTEPAVPKRRTPKASNAALEKPPATDPVEPQVSAENTSEEKPKRRTRKPAASKAKSSTAEAPAAEENKAEPAATEVKPKRRTRRTTAKPKTTATTAEPPSEPAAE